MKSTEIKDNGRKQDAVGRPRRKTSLRRRIKSPRSIWRSGSYRQSESSWFNWGKNLFGKV